MLKKPVFINTSRGKVVNELHLCQALKTGAINAAALDVLNTEPPDYESKLLNLPNVIITPHVF